MAEGVGGGKPPPFQKVLTRPTDGSADLGGSLRTRLLGVGGVGPGVGETGSGVGGLGVGVGGPILRRILWAQFA